MHLQSSAPLCIALKQSDTVTKAIDSAAALETALETQVTEERSLRVLHCALCKLACRVLASSCHSSLCLDPAASFRGILEVTAANLSTFWCQLSVGEFHGASCQWGHSHLPGAPRPSPHCALQLSPGTQSSPAPCQGKMPAKNGRQRRASCSSLSAVDRQAHICLLFTEKHTLLPTLHSRPSQQTEQCPQQLSKSMSCAPPDWR